MGCEDGEITTARELGKAALKKHKEWLGKEERLRDEALVKMADGADFCLQDPDRKYLSPVIFTYFGCKFGIIKII